MSVSQHINVMLFIDEFDMLLEASDAVISSLLNPLHAMKQNRLTFALHSAILIGPFNILQIIESSPFSASNFLECPHFSLAGTNELFNQVNASNRKL